MYKVEWDRETGGVLLSSRVTKETLGISPRPVFHEELDLIGLDKLGWTYPHCEEPLLWAVNKQYWYRGTLLFEAKGANIYDAPTLVMADGVEPMALEPVDVELMLAKNADLMFLVESEAKEFIRDTYETYSRARRVAEASAAGGMDYERLAAVAEARTKRRMAIVKEDCDSFDVMPLDAAREQGKKVLQTTHVDLFIASFSGGKDSQVVLDLCTKVIPPDAFQVIYSDTGYELPSSLELYEQVQAYYHERFPGLKFSTTRNHESVLTYWDKIGTPSDTHRWCCSVMKTAPLYRSLKIEGTNKQARVLAFDGVRAEESTRRSGYQRIGKGVKHSTTINASPILGWNSVEILLYFLRRRVEDGMAVGCGEWQTEFPANPSYRQGMTRVGCLVCPFASEWNEMIASKVYPQQVKPFEEKLRAYSKRSGVRDVDDYIRQGGWKRRSGGRFVGDVPFISFTNDRANIKAVIEKPSKDILSYLWTVGEYSVSRSGSNKISGQLKSGERILSFTVTEKKAKEKAYVFEMTHVDDVILIGHIKRALLKATHCIQCEACEVECPTGALSVYPEVKIDKGKCIHCMRCLDFHERGCVVANSLIITTNMIHNKMNLDRYKNFGLQEAWLESYLESMDDYWTSYHGLHEVYQIPSLKCWLKDAEIIDEKSNITELGKYLAKIRAYRSDLVWEIVWINLTYNSPICKWFADNIPSGSAYGKKMMEEMLKEQFPMYKEKTIHNGVYQLCRTFKESPIGERLCQYVEISKDNFRRESYQDLSEEALVYSLYKVKEKINVTSFNIGDFYREDFPYGPHREFGISVEAFETSLRSLNSAPERVLIAALNMGLQGITLRDDLSSLTALVKATRI